MTPGVVVFRAHCNGYTGYGQLALALAREVEAAGCRAFFCPIDGDDRFVPRPRWMLDRMLDLPHEGAVVQCSTPATPAPNGRSVAFTMWETTRIDARWIAGLDRARAVIVPSLAVRGWFAASGVSAPIRVVPLGVDLDVFRPEGPEASGPIRFGCAGRVAHGGIRKGLDDVVAAFLAAFPGESDVRLDVKVWPDCPLSAPDDPRIRVIREPLSARGLASWYRSLAAFVSASRGEGFGLQPLEAMACGRPVIAPFWGGPLDYLSAEVAWPVRFDERPAEGPIYGGLGLWCRPRLDDLAARMRLAYLDPQARASKGRAAAARGAEFSWRRAGRALVDVLAEFGMIPRDRGA